MDKEECTNLGLNLEQEIKLLQLVSHPNVIKLLRTFREGPLIYLILEYCDGGDLHDKILQRGDSISEREAAEWMSQIFSGIHALHEQWICHRDIKPANLMFCTIMSGKARGQQQLKLADFSIAVHCPRNVMLTGRYGTVKYMAPELFDLPRSEGYCLPVDLWAAGIVMYNIMFAGVHPFLVNGQIQAEALRSAKMDFTNGTASAILRGFLGGPDISAEAQSLIRNLVEPDWRLRASVKSAAASPWFKTMGCDPILGSMDHKVPSQHSTNGASPFFLGACMNGAAA
jgi:calcium-dependent protein kinase